MAEFCRQRGLHPGRMAYWRKVRAEGGPPAFLEVGIRSRAPRPTAAGPGLELVVSHGWKLVIPPGADVHALRAALSALLELEDGTRC